MCLMGTEVMMAKGEPLAPLELESRILDTNINGQTPLKESRYVFVCFFLQLDTPSLFQLNLLFIFPEFLDSEDVQFVSVYVGQETVGLSDRLSLRCAPAVSHQVDTVACTTDTQLNLSTMIHFTKSDCPSPRCTITDSS